MRIALDIGHCSTGDRGSVSACKLAEHDYWAANVPTIKKALETLGHTVKIFRREDHGRLVSRECKAINEWKADVAVSLHLNSADRKSATGHEVIYYPGSSRGLALAKSINSSLAALGYTLNRGPRTPFENRGDTFLSKCRAPAVIVEAGFLSNEQEVSALKTLKNDIALAVARGVNDFFNK